MAGVFVEWSGIGVNSEWSNYYTGGSEEGQIRAAALGWSSVRLEARFKGAKARMPVLRGDKVALFDQFVADERLDERAQDLAGHQFHDLRLHAFDDALNHGFLRFRA